MAKLSIKCECGKPLSFPSIASLEVIQGLKCRNCETHQRHPNPSKPTVYIEGLEYTLCKSTMNTACDAFLHPISIGELHYSHKDKVLCRFCALSFDETEVRFCVEPRAWWARNGGRHANPEKKAFNAKLEKLAYSGDFMTMILEAAKGEAKRIKSK